MPFMSQVVVKFWTPIIVLTPNGQILGLCHYCIQRAMFLYVYIKQEEQAER